RSDARSAAACGSMSLSSLSFGQPPGPTPFPYTTLFRSSAVRSAFISCAHIGVGWPLLLPSSFQSRYILPLSFTSYPSMEPSSWRSEEHTSELQSRENLVCRLLLEKKKHHT